VFWSAINEPRPDHPQIVEELLPAGARFEDMECPTGHEQIDAILQRHRAIWSTRAVIEAADLRVMTEWPRDKRSDR
jgi:hypothetical protein